MTIEERRQRLTPPLRKPDTGLRAAHINRPRLLENFTPKIGPAPAETKKPEKDRHPLREYFCRWCDRRITARLPPPGWINVRRHVYRGSLPIPEGLDKEQQKIYRRRCSMGFGYYCCWECLSAAMPRLAELNWQLNQRKVGLRRLNPGEDPPAMPPHVKKAAPSETRSKKVRRKLLRRRTR